MKITIEIEVPNDPSTYSLHNVIYAAEKAASPDWHGSWWHIEDIQDNASESITDDEARLVLQMMEHNHDANVGLNWDSINVWTDMVINEREEA